MAGKLQALIASDGCAGVAQATLQICNSPDRLPVRAFENLSQYIGQDVRLEGILRPCGAIGNYLLISKIETLSRCDAPTPTQKPRNLALKAAVIAKSQLPDFPATNVVDGDAATGWFAETQAAADSSWIQLDFGTNQTFNQVEISWGEPYAQQYVVYVADERSRQWTPIRSMASGAGKVEALGLNRVRARYLMLYLTRSSAVEGDFAIREWGVYDVPLPNLLLGSGVTTSSAQDAFPGGNAVDGNLETSWASQAGDAAPYRPYIIGRLQTASPLAELDLFWHPSALPGAYRVVLYRGGRAYSQSVDLFPRTSSPIWIFNPPLTADAVGIFVTELPIPPSYVELYEMEIFSPLRQAAMGARFLDPWLTFGGLDGGRDVGSGSRLDMQPAPAGLYPDH